MSLTVGLFCEVDFRFSCNVCQSRPYTNGNTYVDEAPMYCKLSCLKVKKAVMIVLP